MFDSRSQIISFDKVSKEDWDVVIVGSGMGGGTLAYSLVNANKRVLLIEKGKNNIVHSEGVEVEDHSVDGRLDNGKWPEKLTAVIDGRKSDFWPPLGCGVGGSTLLYASALQRFRPEDFDSQTFSDDLGVSWPIKYAELEPYYLQAEDLFRVRGTVDPLEKNTSYDLLPPPPMCEADQSFFQHFQKMGLSPYRLHVGLDYIKACEECGGKVCPKSCKKDVNNCCIQPALKTGNLFILPESEVVSINANESEVSSVTVTQGSSKVDVSGTIIVLSAGAYSSPIILQKSKNECWPNGLANNNDLVGRNIMFHGGAHIAFWPPKNKASRQGANKTIAFRDFYQHDQDKLGEFQSTGISANYGVILYAMRLIFDQSVLRRFSFFRHFLRIPAYIASRLLGEATVFATLVEDFPYKDNRVVYKDSSPSELYFEYNVRPELLTRVKKFNQVLKKRLQLRCIPLWTDAGLNYGHPCGTCKAGDDPDNSVLDKNCKAHGISNLYVVDASFMPTSGATNPSLTIAANALRVADVIKKRLA